MPVADLLTFSRLIAAIALVPVGMSGNLWLFAAVLAWAVVSDAIDGSVARAMGTATERGARLDSLADCALFTIAPLACWSVFPTVRIHATADMVVTVVAYLAPITYGFAKFGRLTSYHTHAARFASIVLACGFAWFLWRDNAWPLHVGVLVLAYSAVEEVVITRRLSAWQSPIRSWRDARARYTGESPFSPVV